MNGNFDSYQLQNTQNSINAHSSRIQCPPMKNCNEITSEINMKLMDIRPIRLTHQFEFIGDSTNEFYGRCVSFISSESREKRTPRLRHTHVYSLCFTPVDERNLSVGAIPHEEKKTIILRYLNDSIPLYQIINSASVLWICPVCNLFSAWIQENAIFFSHHAMASVPF